MKMTVTGSWMVPMCEEAIDYLKYHNPELMWMLDITYKHHIDKRTKKLYTHIGKLTEEVLPWCFIPPFVEVMTVEDFIDKIYIPHTFSLDVY